jgi:ComF family protein
MNALATQLQKAFDILYPRSCAGCGGESPSASGNLCWECRSDIMPVHPPYCSLCGDPVGGRIDHEYVCHFCSSVNPSFDLARSAAHYTGPVAEMLKCFKYKRATWLAPDLATLLAAVADRHFDLDRIDVVTFVPLHRSRQRVREYNQSALLARELAKRIGRRYMNGIIFRHRKTPSQTSLTAQQRISNVKGSFKIRNESWLEGRRLLLVDDVMTTGATVNECAKTLKAGGAASVYVATVARGVK